MGNRKGVWMGVIHNCLWMRLGEGLGGVLGGGGAWIMGWGSRDRGMGEGDRGY